MEAQYDVAFSFAGENREYVEQVASILKGAGVSVFYDRFEEADLWGKDLAVHFDFVYRKSARFCVVFVSAAYKAKLWTRHELRTALSRSIEQNEEYVLPARFDDTELDGLRPTIGMLDLRGRSPEAFAQAVLAKLGKANLPRDTELVTEKVDGVAHLSLHDSFGIGSIGMVDMGFIIRCTITNKLSGTYRYFQQPVFSLKEKFKGATGFFLTNLQNPVTFPVKLEYGQVQSLDFTFSREQGKVWLGLGPENSFYATCSTTIGENYDSNVLPISKILERLR